METALHEFLEKEINLTQVSISQGSKSHNYIRSILLNRRETDSSFPWLLDEDFLSGSYSRATKLHPLNDIDVMMVLDGAGLIPVGLNETHYVIGNPEGLHSPAHQHLGYDNLLNSSSILTTFEKSIKQSHPNSSIKKNGQAVNIQLDAYGLGIDIVPCFHIKPLDNTQKDFYYIPIGNGNPGWLKTNPKIDNTISTRLHEKHNRKLKAIIKLLKYWNREKNNDRIKSYHLESIAWYVFHNHQSQVTSITEGIKYFFTNARTYLEKPLPDATGIGEPVDAYMTELDRHTSLLALDKAKAVVQLSGFLPPAISSWKAIFGNKFGN